MKIHCQFTLYLDLIVYWRKGTKSKLLSIKCGQCVAFDDLKKCSIVFIIFRNDESFTSEEESKQINQLNAAFNDKPIPAAM